ncbi:MAG: hypothetical protein C5S48_00085 [Candidatus Methanogaster sp.]|nr:MAG: hypothetical protein C5S48_00085 [ANME-2 cluster archaeon]
MINFCFPGAVFAPCGTRSEDLGYVPRYGIEEGLKEAIGWFRGKK